MKEKKITHEIRLMQVSNAMFLTVNSLGNDSTRIDLGFPPIDDLSLPFIGSLNAGAKFYTNSERTPFSFGDDVFEMLSDGHSQAIRVRVGWDTPFDQLFKDGGGPDVFMHHQIMLRKAVEKAYSDDPRKKEDATRIAEAWVGRLSRHVQLPWDALKYRAMFLGDEYKIISAREELAMKNISIANLDELNGKEGAALWQKKTEVLRFDSWLGYFWWEFLNDLRSQTSGTHCRRCGESIQNKSRLKKYCSKKDNPNCYRGYERDKKQKQRTALSFIKGQIQTRDCELRSETEIDASGILNG